MEPLYDVTMFLAIGLATIVVTVFIIATTFLGRALEYAQREVVQKAEEIRKIRETRKTDIQSELDKLRQQGVSSKEIQSLEKRVRKAEKEVTKAERELKSSAETPHLLRLRRTVVMPGVVFIVAAVASAIAKAYYSTDIPDYWSIIIWGLGLVCFGVGVYIVLTTMGHIQRVGAATEEGLFQKQTEALTRALQAFDESKRPMLQLTLLDMPYRFNPSTEYTIRFFVTLTKGAVARNVELHFFAPSSFQFIALQSISQSEDFILGADYISVKPVSTAALLSDLSHSYSIRIKTPGHEGEYTLAYRIQSEDFTGEYVRFNVVVRGNVPAEKPAGSTA